jgi:hypothetical protein
MNKTLLWCCPLIAALAGWVFLWWLAGGEQTKTVMERVMAAESDLPLGFELDSAFTQYVDDASRGKGIDYWVKVDIPANKTDCQLVGDVLIKKSLSSKVLLDWVRVRLAWVRGIGAHCVVLWQRPDFAPGKVLKPMPYKFFDYNLDFQTPIELPRS